MRKQLALWLWRPYVGLSDINTHEMHALRRANQSLRRENAALKLRLVVKTCRFALSAGLFK
jgi:hypothetical protein